MEFNGKYPKAKHDSKGSRSNGGLLAALKKAKRVNRKIDNSQRFSIHLRSSGENMASVPVFSPSSGTFRRENKDNE
jgi:hypothetical protein